jgi:hypothetical protein
MQEVPSPKLLAQKPKRNAAEWAEAQGSPQGRWDAEVAQG